MKRPFFLLLVLLLFPAWACCSGSGEPVLEQVTVISRHGVRTPLKKYMNTLDALVDKTDPDRQWVQWPAEGGHLTLRGGILEYASGVYWHGYLEDKGFKCMPDQVYFCASPKHRTVWSAIDFAAGAFPEMEIDVQYSGEKDFSDGFLDPDFLPILCKDPAGNTPFDTTAFQTEARREMDSIAATLTIPYKFLEDILGIGNSRYGKDHFCRKLNYNLRFGGEDCLEEPNLKGSGLSDANMASDAFILQFYEVADAKKASFGHDFTFEDWCRIASVKDAYGRILFTAPIVAVNISHKMFIMLREELNAPDRKFNFICTHDSMMSAMLAAMRVKPYELPSSIEKDTPIGFQIVLEKWRKGGRSLGTVSLVYNTIEQIREESPARMVSNIPAKVKLEFEGLKADSEGYYQWKDIEDLINHTISAYDLTAKGENPFK